MTQRTLEEAQLLPRRTVGSGSWYTAASGGRSAGKVAINTPELLSRQALPPGARLPTSGSFGSVSAQPLPQHPSPAPGGQPKAPGQNHAMQRQLALQPHISNDSDKVNPQDQLSRHLTRPPPDYKQPRRNLTEPQQNNPYKGGGLPLGMNSAQALTGALSGQSGLQPSACHLPSGQGARMTPPPADRRFGGRPDPTQGAYSVQAISTQLQPHGNQNPPMGPNQNQNGPRFPGGSNLGNAFRSNGQQMRPPGGQEAPGLPRQRLVSMLTGTSVGSPPPNWAQGPKQQQQQVRLGLRRFPGPLPPHPGAQANMGSTGGHHFPQRPLVPPNQMAPDTPMLPLNQAMNGQGAGPGPNRGPAPRPPQPRMPPPLPTVSSLNQSPTSQAGSLGPFGAPSAQNARPGYQGNQASGDLTFDFLQDGDNTVPGINSDSDFIDSLLKSGPGNDDWMKDINLDEILGSHS
ncbi:hypothetical protein AGOR_G00030910 [Albula goreensis]|uniref:Mastermind-like protein 2 n=1 Tax=Albula goreensis TaxID=1534307 RepID=A0A8T3E804_9TELE|nr:hypothetical protein AGOR_G00030910 [Albula goreensis]